MNARVATTGLLLLLGACATRPGDPFALAERALHRHDLAEALQALDAVPVAHPRYPQARAAAIEVECSMRRCHELMLEAMLLRSEWRDGEALLALSKVRAIWPRMPGVEVLIDATEQRQRLLGEPTGVAAPPSAPALEPAAAVVPAPAAPAPPAVAAVEGVPADPVVAPVDNSVALALVAVEARLGRGELEGAVVDLLELARRHPTDARVRQRLVRMLHQRALLRYGDGAVAMAIGDWQRVLELEPDHASARRLLEAAEREGR